MNVAGAEALRVTVDDQVSEGCWKYPQATQTAVELELERSGFSVSSEGASVFSPSVIIRSLGFKVGGETCVVSVRLDVMTGALTTYSRGGHQLNGLTLVPLYSNTAVLIAPLSDVGERIKQSHVEFVQDFLVSIKRKQIEILDRAASFSSPQEAKTYWEEQKIEIMHRR
jgi:hypothetical protein